MSHFIKENILNFYMNYYMISISFKMLINIKVGLRCLSNYYPILVIQHHNEYYDYFQY